MKDYPHFCDASHKFCGNLIFLVTGPEIGNMNIARIPIYTSHFMSPTSVKNIVHFTQNYVDKNFRKFDYGRTENMKVYNSVSLSFFI